MILIQAEWFKSNKLSLIIGKTNYVVFKPNDTLKIPNLNIPYMGKCGKCVGSCTRDAPMDAYLLTNSNIILYTWSITIVLAEISRTQNLTHRHHY